MTSPDGPRPEPIPAPRAVRRTANGRFAPPPTTGSGAGAGPSVWFERPPVVSSTAPPPTAPRPTAPRPTAPRPTAPRPTAELGWSIGPDSSTATETDPLSAPSGGSRSIVTRRRFLQGLAVAGTSLGYVVVRETRSVDQPTQSRLAAARSTSSGAPASDGPALAVVATEPEEVIGEPEAALLEPAPVDQRVLVLIEFEGGNDGLSTVVPYTSGIYYDLRPNLAHAPEAVHAIDDEVGLAPGLAALSSRQFATVEGVGPVDGVLSHFEMAERWEQGDISGRTGQRAGFLARVADSVDVGSAVTGLSVAGHTPRLAAATASVLALSNPNQLQLLTKNDWIFPRFRSAVTGFGGGPMSTTIARSWGKLGEVGSALRGDIDLQSQGSAMVRNGGQLGKQLAMAAGLIKADVGVRVIHARHGGFDTHNGHNYRHKRLMEEFDAAVDGFLGELEAAGMADRVLVATSSEFGRRVRENGGGTDHGAASSMLVFGPVRPGRYGQPSPLDDLDGNGNLRTTIPFDRYLASLAQDWLGVEAASVLPNSPQTLALFA